VIATGFDRRGASSSRGLDFTSGRSERRPRRDVGRSDVDRGSLSISDDDIDVPDFLRED
jgi:hypothetical protein